MKTLVYLLIALLLPIFAFTQDDFDYPVDIVYNSETENYYVSNWADGNGYILKLDKDGNIIETFFEGLHYAGGMRISGNTLYVLDNLDLNNNPSNLLPSYLVGINLNTGAEVSNVEISSGGTYLNFMDKANNNLLYITDSQKNSIYQYSFQDNTVTTFLTNLSSPFGICYDYYNDRLLFTANGTGLSYLKSVSPEGGEVTTPFYTDAYIKGVVMHPSADFYYTTWDVNSTQWGDEIVGKVNNDFNWEFEPSYDHNRPFGLCIGYNDVVAVCNWGNHTLRFIDDAVFSVDELSSKSDPYTIYPNPSNGKFNLGFSDIGSSNFELSILNMTGQQVYQEKVNTSYNTVEKSFDLQGLPAGTYVVIIKDDLSVSQKKLIIR